MTDFMCLYSYGGVKTKSMHWIKICCYFALHAMRMYEEKKILRLLNFSSLMSLAV